MLAVCVCVCYDDGAVGEDHPTGYSGEMTPHGEEEFSS